MIIAYTNEKVDHYNSIVRRALFKEKADNVMIEGEPMIVVRAVGADAEGFYTNDRVVMEEFNYDYIEYYDELGEVKELTVVSGQVFNLEDSGDKDEVTKWHFKIVPPMMHDEFHEMMKVRADEIAKTYRKGTPQSRAAWREYFTDRDSYMLLNYSYARTVHKSQGSTFDSVYVDDIDIQRMYVVDDRRRCRYVAYSRPKFKLGVRVLGGIKSAGGGWRD